MSKLLIISLLAALVSTATDTVPKPIRRQDGEDLELAAHGHLKPNLVVVQESFVRLEEGVEGVVIDDHGVVYKGPRNGRHTSSRGGQRAAGAQHSHCGRGGARVGAFFGVVPKVVAVVADWPS